MCAEFTSGGGIKFHYIHFICAKQVLNTIKFNYDSINVNLLKFGHLNLIYI